MYLWLGQLLFHVGHEANWGITLQQLHCWSAGSTPPKHTASNLTTATRPLEFGTYRPNPFQRFIISITRSLPRNWAGRRLGFAFRRIALLGHRGLIDAEVFGQKMRINPRGNVCEKRVLFTPQFFDPEERLHIAKAARDGFVFIDIGANIGAYSLFASGHTGKGCTILAIEPQPDVFARLTENIALNPACGIKAIASAVTDADGEILLFLNADNQGEASIRDLGKSGETKRSITVPAISLLSLVEAENLSHIDAIKLDVEGAEDIILTAFFGDAPRRFWPQLIVLENGSADWQTDCVQLCLDNGYHRVRNTRMNVLLERQPEC